MSKILRADCDCGGEEIEVVHGTRTHICKDETPQPISQPNTEDKIRIPCPDGVEGCSIMHFAPNTAVLDEILRTLQQYAIDTVLANPEYAKLNKSREG